MLYSSGTTGRPKGVAQTFRRAPLETSPTGVTSLAQLLFGFGPDTVYLSPAPLYHAAPLRFTMAATAVGGTAVVMEHFDAEAVPAGDRALPRHGDAGRADDVRPPAQAPGRGARPLRRVVAAHAWCTPPRRARCR